MAQESDYRMSFSTGGLFLRESVEVASLYQSSDGWVQVKQQARLGNTLQTRTTASSTRAIREVVLRLQTLSPAELDLLLDGSPQEQSQLLWVAICRTYPFIREFALEILREFYLTMRGELSYEDFDYFYNKKSDIHPDLDAISLSTRSKLRQVLFRMMREAGLLTAQSMILPALLTPRFIEVVAEQSTDDLRVFPVFDAEIRRMAR